ncbi:hypothetical protein K450DRAFT_242401 [Umbelopsis ramanniana AG]|uniref:Uncharacterized protein n=1 Tax=Umbelopsis ramanniana AG TaxID=1314678 RepID=A0AAD5HCI8_UMBRA|nr:uncharacterized protein K450DRAFT_242401 [Umbelopsis ramanniana AG]KAI8579255.1 hypothetical protein K450DRAFT_242401 [Umbelopsis ramanniana AG]
MKSFITTAAAVWLSLTYVSAQITSSTGNFNVTNPVENQTYVTGQQLPITWRLLGTSDFSSLQLEIVLTNTLSGNYSETVIMAQADVSASNQQTANNVTFYEHSLNYPIPATAPLGNYNVIFMSKDTSTNTTVPIQIIAPAATSSSVAAPSSSAGAAASGTLTASSSNPFASKADKVSPIQMAGFTLAAIGAVAAIVF